MMRDLFDRPEIVAFESELKDIAKRIVSLGMPADAAFKYIDYFVHASAGEFEGVRVNGRPNAAAVSGMVGSNRVRARRHYRAGAPKLAELCAQCDVIQEVLDAWARKHPRKRTLKRSEFNALWEGINKDLPVAAVEKAGHIRSVWVMDRTDREITLVDEPPSVLAATA